MIAKGEATVVKNAGSHYLLSALPEWNLFPAVLRGKIRLKASEITNPIAVGDRVRYQTDDSLDAPALITEILPRSNYVIRRSTNLSRQAHIIAANVDRAYIIVSLYFPEIKLPFLDRILVTCEVYGVPVTIVLSKVDMYRDVAQEQIDAFKGIYEGAGYRVIETSVETGEGIDEIREACKGKINLFNQKHELDERPIEEGCMCPVCAGQKREDGTFTGGYSRAYIRHLLKAKEMLGMRLCVLHNLYFYNHLTEEIRGAIRGGNWDEWKTGALSDLETYDRGEE